MKPTSSPFHSGKKGSRSVYFTSKDNPVMYEQILGPNVPKHFNARPFLDNALGHFEGSISAASQIDFSMSGSCFIFKILAECFRRLSRRPFSKARAVVAPTDTKTRRQHSTTNIRLNGIATAHRTQKSRDRYTRESRLFEKKGVSKIALLGH